MNQAGQGNYPAPGSIAQANIHPDYAFKQAQNAPLPPATLVSAMGSLDNLNQRLATAIDGLTKLAVAIGGPWPCDPTDGGKPDVHRPAIVELNDGLATAHRRVDAIEQASGAMQRTLGCT